MGLFIRDSLSRRDKIMEDFDFASLLYILDMAVLERQEDGAFRVVGHVPPWFLKDDRAVLTDVEAFHPEDYYPFFDSFLVEAESFWQDHPVDTLCLRSAPWAEGDFDEEAFHLEAMAIHVKNKKVILIRRLGKAFEEKALILQKAREKLLEYERIKKSHRNIRKDYQKLEDSHSLVLDELLDIIR
jgi:hypothetical protein